MSERDDQFLINLLATFKIEAHEHLQSMASGLLALEKTISAAEQRSLIEGVFRAAHSLKGAARAVNLAEVERICQTLEDTFAGWKRQGRASAQSVDQVHQWLDRLSGHIAGGNVKEAVAPAGSPPCQPAIPDGPGDDIRQPAAGSSEKQPMVYATDTVRIAVSKLDDRLIEAEEMLSVKLAARQRVADLRLLGGRLEAWQKEWARIQPELRQVRTTLAQQPSAPGSDEGLRRLIDFMEWNQAYMHSFGQQAEALRQTADQDHLMTGKLVDDLLEDSKRLLMLPLSTMGAFFPKLVRDLCRDEGKEAELLIEGDDVEMDKRILEEMKDPIMHLLRNSVDHGVELPEVRKELGKPVRASITLAVTPVDGHRVEIRVTDDGRGIDPAKVKASALGKGLISSEEAAALSGPDALRLIFRSDFSTRSSVTPVSGRGLGLAIVQEKAEMLGGQVSVESVPRLGTTIRISLPVTLATFRGVMVEAGKQVFVIPTSHVERVIRFRSSELVRIEGRPAVDVGGKTVVLAPLAELLEMPVQTAWREFTTAAVIGKGEQRVALAVDAVLNEQEVLVKRFRKPLVRIRNVMGATVLGNGQVAAILEVSDLMKSARKTPLAPEGALKGRTSVKPAHATVLVAEDSITSRMLLKGVLESAGYRVRTAVDGEEAFTSLKTEPADLVVSDVEMPRMNGFDLTARIRADKKLENLPVILVTALESPEHRERGMVAGANAYLAKSSLDQGELLKMIRQLI